VNGERTLNERFVNGEQTLNERFKPNVNAMWTLNGKWSIHSDCLSFFPYMVYFLMK
jgi:hypothetical protein